MALTKDDLQAIRQITEEVVDERIEKFAVMVANSFRSVDQRFDAVDAQLNDIRSDIARIERRQEAEQAMLDSHDRRITALEHS